MPPVRSLTVIVLLVGFLSESTATAQSQEAAKETANSPTDQRPLGVGQTPTQELVKAWNIDIAPDGANLPDGSDSVTQGQKIFADVCAACHGERGNEGPMDRLVGGKGTLDTKKPIMTVGSYWPYATTLYDYIHRAMPLNAPQSLSADQVYAVTAYILNLNKIIPDDAVLDKHSLPAVEMPNRDGFEHITAPGGVTCMTNCEPLVGPPKAAAPQAEPQK
jgi:S-disulfanyl-L-cysteine oxidoreductase SoxD